MIDDARRRQRRRRLVVAAAVAAVGIGVAARGELGGGDRSRPASQPAPRVVAPGTVLSEPPSVAVACHVPASLACDRIVVFAETRRPVAAVSAEVEGATSDLNDPEWSGPLRHGRRTRFAGFLHAPGLFERLGVRPDSAGRRYIGRKPVAVPIRLRISRRDGRTVVTRTSSRLYPGFG